MKWFKHDSDAGNDAKLRKLRMKYGAQGYGIYWYCLELIARNVEKHNLTFELEHDAELIADDFKLSGELVQEMMIYMVNLGLFENSQGVITCIKMSTRTDEYTQKLLKELKECHDKLPTKSEQNTRKSELIEEKRREEIYTPDFVNQDLWVDFLEIRKSVKAKNTPRAIKLLVAELKKLVSQGHDANAVIEASIRNSWKDVYPLKSDPKATEQDKSKKPDWLKV